MIMTVRPRKRKRERAKAASNAPPPATMTVRTPAVSEAPRAGRKFGFAKAVTKLSPVNSCGSRCGGQAMSSEPDWKDELIIQYTGISHSRVRITPPALASGWEKNSLRFAARSALRVAAVAVTTWLVSTRCVVISPSLPVDRASSSTAP
ncbi:Uncharacterised protein [Mycobacterium tuberculosis]|nr:Uncharacterised protein [Mycobacterium tuberculosis]